MYLIKRGRWYYFNKRISSSLLRIALRTTRKRTAQRRAVFVHYMIRRLMLMGMTHEQILQAAKHLADQLLQDFESRLRSGAMSVSEAEMELSEHYVERLRSFYGDDPTTPYRPANKLSDQEKIQGYAETSFTERAFKLLELPEFNHSPAAVIKALQGIAPEKPQTLIRMPISTYLSHYFADIKAKGTTRESTIKEYESGIRDFIDICGDRPVDSYSSDDARYFRDTMLKLPKQRRKAKAYRDKSIDELVTLNLPAASRLSQSYVSDIISYTSSLFQWLVGEQLINTNPFSNVSLKKASSSYVAFTDDDLAALFSSPLYQGRAHNFWNGKNVKACNASNWWALLLLLYTGARSGEIAQLRTSDVIEQDSIPCLSLLDEEKQIKTKAGRRIIPIHSALIRLGFLDYVTELKSSRIESLLPLLKQAKKRSGGEPKYSSMIGGWFLSQYRDRVPELQQMKAEKKTVHSFRHTLIEKSYGVNAQLEVIQQIVGHTNKEEAESRTYRGRGYTAPQMKVELEKIFYPTINLEHLAKHSWSNLQIT